MICFTGHISVIARIRKLMIEGHVRDFCESSLQQGLLFVLYLCNCIEAGRGKAPIGHRFFTERTLFQYKIQLYLRKQWNLDGIAIGGLP